MRPVPATRAEAHRTHSRPAQTGTAAVIVGAYGIRPMSQAGA